MTDSTDNARRPESENEITALRARAEAAEAALATARRDALEEAIAAVGEIPCKIGDTKHYWRCQDAIRALANEAET